MAAVTFGSTAAAGSAPNGTGKTVSLTTSALDTRLIVLAGNDTGNGPPTTMSYNGVNLTNDFTYNPVAGMNVSEWRMDNPPAGTFNVIATWPTSTTGFGMIAIPLRGADLAQLPIAGTGANGSSVAPACSVAGAGANDLQLAVMMARSTTCVSAGAPQGVVVSVATMPITSINTLDSFTADSIPGANAGNFAWTITSGTWVCIAMKILAPTASGGGTGTGGPAGGKWSWMKRR